LFVLSTIDPVTTAFYPVSFNLYMVNNLHQTMVNAASVILNLL
jgi:hypothetical protein